MKSTSVLTRRSGPVSSAGSAFFFEEEPIVDSVDRIHSISEELRQVKSAHDQSVALLLLKRDEAMSVAALDWNHRVRIRISERLFSEMRRVMGELPQ